MRRLVRRQAWSTAEPFRRIFRQGLERAGQPYFKPYSIRDTRVQLGKNDVQGVVADHRQDALIWGFAVGPDGRQPSIPAAEGAVGRLEAELVPTTLGGAR